MKQFKKVTALILAVAMIFGSFGTFPAMAASEIIVGTAMSKEEYTDEATGETMPYRLYVPENYDETKEYPVIVFLHGAGERGSNNESQLVNGIQAMFDTQEQMKESIVIAPQCPSGKRWVETDWTQGNYDSSKIEEEQLGIVMNILASVQDTYSTDDDRIYAVGISMGGFGAWNLLMNHSDVFAAGIPMCAGADPNKVDILKNIPIWTFHGCADPTVPYAGTAEMYNKIVSAGGNVLKFTTYPSSAHNIWETAAKTEGLIDWLFAQKLSERTEAEKVEAANLFDKNDSDVWLNALSYNGEKRENATSYANVFTTHPIEVENGDTIYWGGFAQEKYVMELYAKDGSFLKQVTFDETQKVATGSTVQGVGTSAPEVHRYAYRISDADAGFVRILGNISIMDSFAVYLNLEEDLEGWPGMKPVQESVLNGKSILFVGDSITAATRDDYNRSGWAGRIGFDYGMDSTNGGVSGASLSTIRGAKRILAQIMSRVDNDYDYLIFHGGVNDAMDSAPIGEVSDSFDVDDFDITTYAGGLEELFYQAYVNYEDTAFGYIINYATPNSTWGGNTPDMTEYFEVGKQICEKWNVPYIDLFSGTVEVDGETLSYSYDILDVMSGENMYNDDEGEVHIGGSGYDLIAPYIGEWVETLQTSIMPEGLVKELNDYRGKITKLFGKLENYVFSVYTEETLEILDIAVVNAEAVLADETASDEEVKAAYELLLKAVDSLEMDENIALQKPVAASHNDANAYKITDGSLSTYWESKEGDDIAIADSSFVIDLQGIYEVDAITAVPYYASDSRIYHYDILVSTDNETWTTAAEQRSTEYATEAGATFELGEPVEARYIKVDGVSMSVVERPSLINFHMVEMRAYGTLLEEVEETKVLENLALYGKVTANAGTTNVGYITDGTSTSNYYTNSKAAITDSYVTVELPGEALVDNVRVVTYSKDTSKWYTWEVFVSDDNETWTSVGAYTTESNPGYPGVTVTLEEPVSAKYVKVQGVKTNNTNLHLVEVEVYGTLDNIAKGKTVTASAVNGSYVATNAVDGSFGTYWDAAATEWSTATAEELPYIVVDLEGTYELENVNVMNYRKDDRHYKYQIYTSMDGEEYTLLAQKDNTDVSLYNLNYDANGTTARYIKLVGTFNSKNSGYHVVELRATGTLIPEADADYSAVEAAIAKIPEDLSIYTAASVVDLKLAVLTVKEGLTESRQAEVDAMAAAIEEAVAALVLIPVETPTPEVTPTATPEATPTATPEVTPTTIPTPSPEAGDATNDIPIALLSAVAGDSQELGGSNTTEGPASFVLDSNPYTLWHTNWDGSDRSTNWIVLKVAENYDARIMGLRYLPRVNAGAQYAFGTIISYRVEVSEDGENWEVAAEGTWLNDAAWKCAYFKPRNANYVRLVSVDSISDERGAFTSAAEIRLAGSVKEVIPPTTPEETVTPEPTEEPTVEPTVEPTETEDPQPTETEAPVPTETEVPQPTETEVPQPTETPVVKEEVTTVFDDVYTDWYTDYVQYVYDNDLMTGIKGTKHFAPNANITKAQVAQVLYNMENQPTVEDRSVFTELNDVYAAEWYANAVAWAYNEGVVTGDLNTKKFSPNADVTREQLALMMFRYAQFKKYDISATTDYAGLVNADKVNNWAADGVKWAVGAGLISGIEKNGVKDLAPQGNASRAQVAAILQRFCSQYIK